MFTLMLAPHPAGAGSTMPNSYWESKREKDEDDSKPKIMYHYTDEKGYYAILLSQVLLPSIKKLKPSDAIYGDGVYLTDLVPGQHSLEDLSRALVRNRFSGHRFTHYIAIDVNGLPLKFGREKCVCISYSISFVYYWTFSKSWTNSTAI